MTHPLLQIDAFSEGPFSGNPAAVVLMDRPLDESLMQRIAEENNLAETAFVLPIPPSAPGSEGTYALRWFTPTTEVELCGHATLAAAVALRASGHTDASKICFSTKSGVLIATAHEDDQITIDLPAVTSAEPVTSEQLAELERALNVRIVEAHVARYALVILESEAAVAEVAPTREALMRFGIPIVITAESDEPTIDFVSRFFAPTLGVFEDPVTGSAHCQLVPYWAAQRGHEHMIARQISKRGGRLECRLRGTRVELKGAAHVYLRGSIETA